MADSILETTAIRVIVEDAGVQQRLSALQQRARSASGGLDRTSGSLRHLSGGARDAAAATRIANARLDDMSRAARNAAAAMRIANARLDDMSRAARNTGQRVDGMGQNFVAVRLRTIAMGIAFTGATIAVRNFGRQGVSELLRVQNAINILEAEGGSNLGDLRQELDDLRDSAGDVGRTFGRGDLAEALSETVKAGESATNALTLMRASMNLAAQGEQTLGEATKLLLTNLRQFGLEAEDAARVSDSLTRANLLARGSTAELQKGLSTIGPVANLVGLDIEETTALLIALDNVGLEAAERGATALRTAFTQLLDPTSKSRDELARLGVALKDSEGRTRPTLDVLRDLSEALTGSATAGESLAVIFDTRAVTGVAALVEAFADGKFEIDEFIELLRDAEGAAAEMADIMKDDLQGALERVGAEAENLGETFFNTFGDTLADMLDTAADKIGNVETALRNLSNSNAFQVLLALRNFSFSGDLSFSDLVPLGIHLATGSAQDEQRIQGLRDQFQFDPGEGAFFGPQPLPGDRRAGGGIPGEEPVTTGTSGGGGGSSRTGPRPPPTNEEVLAEAFAKALASNRFLTNLGPAGFTGDARETNLETQINAFEGALREFAERGLGPDSPFVRDAVEQIEALDAALLDIGKVRIPVPEFIIEDLRLRDIGFSGIIDDLQDLVDVADSVEIPLLDVNDIIEVPDAIPIPFADEDALDPRTGLPLPFPFAAPVAEAVEIPVPDIGVEDLRVRGLDFGGIVDDLQDLADVAEAINVELPVTAQELVRVAEAVPIPFARGAPTLDPRTGLPFPVPSAAPVAEAVKIPVPEFIIEDLRLRDIGFSGVVRDLQDLVEVADAVSVELPVATRELASVVDAVPIPFVDEDARDPRTGLPLPFPSAAPVPEAVPIPFVDEDARDPRTGLRLPFPSAAPVPEAVEIPVPEFVLGLQFERDIVTAFGNFRDLLVGTTETTLVDAGNAVRIPVPGIEVDVPDAVPIPFAPGAPTFDPLTGIPIPVPGLTPESEEAIGGFLSGEETRKAAEAFAVQLANVGASTALSIADAIKNGDVEDAFASVIGGAGNILGALGLGLPGDLISIGLGLIGNLIPTLFGGDDEEEKKREQDRLNRIEAPNLEINLTNNQYWTFQGGDGPNEARAINGAVLNDNVAELSRVLSAFLPRIERLEAATSIDAPRGIV